MNLKEYAEANGISFDEAKKQTGLTHWKQEVPEQIETKSTEVDYTESKQVTKEDAWDLRGGAGDKTIEFMKFVKENKTSIPEEYNRVKHLIERFSV